MSIDGPGARRTPPRRDAPSQSRNDQSQPGQARTDQDRPARREGGDRVDRDRLVDSAGPRLRSETLAAGDLMAVSA